MTYELVIDDEKLDEVFAISLVENPAIEVDFVYFNEQVNFSAVNDEQRLVMGPLLLPNRKILRVDGAGYPYHVFFSEKTVRRLAEMFLEKKYTDKATLEHQKPIDGVKLVESWIIESREKDKSKLYNFNLPVGTWMGVMKIEDDKLWNDYVKTGKVKGFSVEALLGHNLVAASKETIMSKNVEDLNEEEAEILLAEIKAVIQKDNRFKTKKRITMESYSDYPDGVKNNAKRAVEWAQKNGWGSCGTPVGKTRASQLAKGEPISVETIKRMFSYLSRHEGDLETSTSFGEGCGYLMYQAWGGKAALSWSRNKLRELGLLQENEAQPSIPASSYPGQGPTSGSYVAPALFQEEGELNVFGYDTQYFYVCPGAYGTFTHLTQEMDIQDGDLQDMIRAAAVIADSVFRIEVDVLLDEYADNMDVERATELVRMMKDVFQTINERTGMNHDISYMDGHIDLIKSYL